MSALSQQYDAGQVPPVADQLEHRHARKANIAADQQQVAKDKNTLSKAAVANYISDGTAAAQNPIFSGNEETLGATTEYNQIAEGDISLAVDNLHTAENSLNAQESQLQGEQTQAQNQVTAEQNAVAQNQQAIQQQKSALSQEQGQIATLVKQQQEAEARRRRAGCRSQAAAAAAAAAAARRSHPAAASPASAAAHAWPRLCQAAPPPTAAGGAGAVQAAESQIGVPYVWGGESPKGSASPGFDCSGLTAWSWGQVGVGLPHYSGAQMADSTPVPISDLQPGDLLFYGPGGSEHVAMYVGPGEMIEAPYTGAWSG